MSLDKASLKSSLKSAFTSLQNSQNLEPDSSADVIATAIAQAIDTFIKSGTVKVTADTGLISVTGSATAQKNPSPITIEGVVE